MDSQLIWIICLCSIINKVEAPNLAKLRESVKIEEQRAYIKLSVLLNKSVIEVSNDLAHISPASHMSRTQVYVWFKDFKEGKRVDIGDLPRSGRPRETTDEENKEWVKDLILESDGMNTNDLLYETNLPETSLRRLLNEIGARKILSRWVPHELTTRQKKARHAIAGKHLASYQRESGFLNNIIAINETWLKSYDPKDSRQTSEWILSGQRP